MIGILRDLPTIHYPSGFTGQTGEHTAGIPVPAGIKTRPTSKSGLLAARGLALAYVRGLGG